MLSDYSQMELRILAMVTQDERLLRAFLEGRDIHRFVAAIVLGKAEHEVTKAERRRIKAIVFGLCFGRGPGAIAAQEHISVQAARELIDQFFDTFPKVKRWVNEQHKYVRKHHRVWTPSGFRRVFLENFYADDELDRRAVNTPIQGSASDVTVHAIAQLYRLLKRMPSFRSLLWATIHDALAFDVHPGELYDMAVVAKKCMVDMPARNLDWLTVGLRNDYEVGASWGELLEMEVLSSRRLRLKGPTTHYERFIETVMQWPAPPVCLTDETKQEEGDDGKMIDVTTSTWEFSPHLQAV